VLTRHSALAVTARSIGWGALSMLPLVIFEWLAGARAAPTARGLVGALYLAVVITALGYLVWNWALSRVGAPRAAIFVTVQPIAGALLGVGILHEPLTPFTAAGGLLIVAGLWLTVTGQG
jgi:drug/metabolite transporter (DMT)-like permease